MSFKDFILRLKAWNYLGAQQNKQHHTLGFYTQTQKLEPPVQHLLTVPQESWSFGRSVGWSVVGQSVGQSINQSIIQSINQSVNQSINQSISC